MSHRKEMRSCEENDKKELWVDTGEETRQMDDSHIVETSIKIILKNYILGLFLSWNVPE
jgi:hypothetical protein